VGISKYITVFVGMIFAFSIYSQGEHPELIGRFVRINLNAAAIKSAKTSKCTEILLNKISQDTVSIKIFNREGNLLQHYFKSDTAGGSTASLSSYFYLYDSYGKLIQRIDSLSSGSIKNILDYDDMGNITERESKSGSSTVSEASFDYDAMGRLIETVYRDVVMNCKTTEKYIYNTYNDMVKISSKSTCGDSDDRTITTQYNYKYDKQDKIIEKISILPGGSNKTETFSYDPKGNLKEMYVSTSNDYFINYVFVNDSVKNTTIVEVTESFNDAVNKSYRTIVKDNFGNVQEEIFEDAAHKEIFRKKFVYEYF
jgi:hypothetical protein